MIGFLRGTIIEADEGQVLVEAGGIGYVVEMPASILGKLPEAGRKVELYTHLVIRDDRINLYGFMDKKSLMLFKVLLQVSGVGPRLALNILSVLSPDELVSDIAQGDGSRIRSVHGVGKKTAARICVDLKEKASKILAQHGVEEPPFKAGKRPYKEMPFFDDAVSALVNLGYRPKEAKKAIRKVLKKQTDVNMSELIKMGLGYLSKGR